MLRKMNNMKILENEIISMNQTRSVYVILLHGFIISNPAMHSKSLTFVVTSFKLCASGDAPINPSMAGTVSFAEI
jgi:hypothetical protein